MALTIDDILKVDIQHRGDFAITVKGDLEVERGKENLKQAIFRRLMTIPGTVVHRPEYGVGVPMYLNRLLSSGNIKEMQGAIRSQLVLDPRIISVDSVTVEKNSSTPGQLKVRVVITGQGLGQVDTGTLLFG